jgi:hypothetical protein
MPEKQYPLDPPLLDVDADRGPSRYQLELDRALLRGCGFVYNLDGKVTNVPLRPSFNPSERKLT